MTFLHLKLAVNDNLNLTKLKSKILPVALKKERVGEKKLFALLCNNILIAKLTRTTKRRTRIIKVNVALKAQAYKVHLVILCSTLP